MPGIVQN